MLKLKAFALALFLSGAFAAQAAAQETVKKSLYERLGGEAAISAVVDDFAGRVLKDEKINKKFAKTDAPRLLFHLKEQVCAATGGPCKYTGLSMKESHKHMGVTEGEFNALVGHLVATLDHFKVPEAEKTELLGILGPLKDQIVEVKGDATGTPLPAEFKPAPPLDKSKLEKGPFPKPDAKPKM